MKAILSLFLFLFCFNLSSQDLDTVQLNRFFDHIVENNEGCGSIAIMLDGETIYQRGYGFAQKEEEGAGKNNPQTLFRIGSITKTFTATLVMMAIEEDKLSLETKLSEFYPAFNKSDSISIAHLLQHRSGLFNFTNSLAYPMYMTEKKSKEALIEILKQAENQFSPGSQFQYSNTGYVLLTYILEDVYKMPYKQLLTTKIIEPLGLSNTFYQQEIATDKNEALSYSMTTTTWEKSPITDLSIPLGAGGITSTADNVNIFYSALFNQQLVSKESLAEMTTMVDNYGFGLLTMPYGRKLFFGHTGGIDSFQSVSCYQKEDKLQITLLCNAVSYSRNEILLGVLKTFYKDNFELPDFSPVIELEAEDLEGFAGIYTSESFPLDITIATKENNITAQATGQQAFPLSAVDTNTFIFKPAGIKITFDREKQSLTLIQAGSTFTLTKD